MRKLLLFFVFLLSIGILFISAKSFKVNVKTFIKPYDINIEKVEIKDNKTFIYGSIKIKGNYSYNLNFDNCKIISEDSNSSISGNLIKWNGSSKISNPTKFVNNSTRDLFVLEFPGENYNEMENYKLVIGTIENKNNFPIIVENLSLKRK